MSNENQQLFLAVLEEELAAYDQYSIEHDLWDSKKDYDLYTVPIEAVALYITQATIEEYEPCMQDISNEYRERLSKKCTEVAKKITLKAGELSYIDYLNDMPQRIQDSLGMYAASFATLPKRYKIKTVLEAKEIVSVIEKIELIHEDELINIKKILKKDKSHGRPKLTGTVPELNNRIKDYCSKHININDNYKKEKILNRIAKIVTTP